MAEMFREGYDRFLPHMIPLMKSYSGAKSRGMFVDRLRHNPRLSNRVAHYRGALFRMEDDTASSEAYNLGRERLERQLQRMEVSLIDLFKNLFTLGWHCGTRIFVINRKEMFGEDYFINGIKSGLSNYENYSYREDLTRDLARKLVEHLGIEYTDTVLDYGCARGFLVKALDVHCFPFGKDISSWAIQNCHSDIADKVSNDLSIDPKSFDWIVSKDVCEHIPSNELDKTLLKLINGARKGVFIIVPLSNRIDKPYIRPEDNQDVTHETRWPLELWLKTIHVLAPDFQVEASYYIPGIKPASSQVPFSCGFFTLKRLR